MGQAALIQALVHQPPKSRLTDKGLGGLVWFRGGCFVLRFRFWFGFPQKKNISLVSAVSVCKSRQVSKKVLAKTSGGLCFQGRCLGNSWKVGGGDIQSPGNLQVISNILNLKMIVCRRVGTLRKHCVHSCACRGQKRTTHSVPLSMRTTK